MVAERLRIDRSTVYREIRRNRHGDEEYQADRATQRTRERRTKGRRPTKLNEPMTLLVDQYLAMKWSPQQISGFLKAQGSSSVSHESIYQHVLRDHARGGSLYRHLRQGRRQRRKHRYPRHLRERPRIPNRVSIEQRPKEVEGRQEAGHWELDTMVGTGHSGVLVTAVERKSRLTKIRLLERGTATAVYEAVTDMLWPYKESLRSLTSDNGLEFYQLEKIAEALHGFRRPSDFLKELIPSCDSLNL
jgi:IS30 family transposase